MIKRILFSGLILSFFFFVSHSAHAAAYSASDLLGQIGANNSVLFTNSFTDNGPNDKGFNAQTDTALDAVGHRLFVSDTSNNRILIFDLDVNNNILSRTASHVLGQANFISNVENRGGSASSSTFYNPTGLAYDSTDSRLFVADGNNNRVLIFNVPVATTTNGQPASHVLGQVNFTNSTANPGGISSSTLRVPKYVAYDSTNSRLFVSDAVNNRVLIFNVPVATTTDGQPASRVLGQTGFTVNSSSITSSTFGGELSGIAYDPVNSRLFVNDFNSVRVLIFNVPVATTTNGEPASHVLGQVNFASSSTGTSSSTLNYPRGLSYDSGNSRLFIADTSNNRVLIFNVPVATTTDGQPASNVLGQVNFTTGTGGTSSSSLSSPFDFAYDSANSRLFVSDSVNNRVLLYNTAVITNGMPAIDLLGHLDINNEPNFIVNTVNNAPNAEGLNTPSGIVLDTTHHRLFVADTSNNRISVFNLDVNNNLVDPTADFVLGQLNFVTNDALSATASSTNFVRSIAYDSVNDRLFAADNKNRVLVFNTAVLSNGMSASYVIGQTNFASSSFGTTSSTINSNPFIRYDSAHNRLFLSDGGNHRVLIFNVSTSTISNGMSASYVLGEPNFTTVSAGTTSSTLNTPLGMAYDSVNDRLFISDSSNIRVMVYNLSSVYNGMPASYVIGQTDFVSSLSGTSSSSLSYVNDLAYDSASKVLFVADNGNNRVLTFDTSMLATGMPAAGVLGQADFVSANATTTQMGLNGIFSLDYDSANERLYATDQNNNRVIIYNFVKLSTSSLVSGTANASYSQNISAYNSQGTVSMSLYSGSLPPGIMLSTAGLLSGTPTTAGTYNFAVTASDTVPGIGYFVDPTSYTITITGGSPATEPSHGGQTLADLYPGLNPGGGVSVSKAILPSSTTILPSSKPSININPSSRAQLQVLLKQLADLQKKANLPTKRIFTRALAPGETSDAIRDLQKFLNQNGFLISQSGAGSPGNETNKYGLLTRKALCRFQVLKGIVNKATDTACGIFGPKTRAFVNGM